MFNLFKKPQPPQEPHPITKVFNDLTQNQRMSVINLLSAVASANGEDGTQQKIRILNEYLGFLGVRGDKVNEYLRRVSHDGMISDLITLSRSQKELLVVTAQDIILCSRQRNEDEIVTAAELFERIGIDEHEFIAICQKSQALMKYFS